MEITIKYRYRACNPDEIKPVDMRVELAKQLGVESWEDFIGEENLTPPNLEIYEAWSWDSEHEEAATIDMQLLWFSDVRRAMICISGSGCGDSVWTDADNVQDAIEKFLGINGKKIQE